MVVAGSRMRLRQEWLAWRQARSIVSLDKRDAMSWRRRSRMGMIRGGMGGLRSAIGGVVINHQVARSTSHAQDATKRFLFRGYDLTRRSRPVKSHEIPILQLRENLSS